MKNTVVSLCLANLLFGIFAGYIFGRNTEVKIIEKHISIIEEQKKCKEAGGRFSVFERSNLSMTGPVLHITCTTPAEIISNEVISVF